MKAGGCIFTVVVGLFFGQVVSAAEPPPRPAEELFHKVASGKFQTKFQASYLFENVLRADRTGIVVNTPNASGTLVPVMIPAAYVSRMTLLEAGADLPLQATLRASQTNSGHKLVRNWDSSWGSYDHTKQRVVKLDVALEVLPGYAAKLPVLEYVFLAGSEAQSGNTELALSERRAFTLTSNSVAENDANYKLIGKRYISGSRPSGWALRIIAADKVLAVAASDEQLRKTMSEPAGFKTLAE